MLKKCQPTTHGQGPIIGKNKRGDILHISKTAANQNVAVFGPSGSGKTHCYTMSNLIQSIDNGESVIVAATDAELYNKTADYARHNGYTVKVLNFDVPAKSDTWDMLASVGQREREKSISELAYIIVSNTLQKYPWEATFYDSWANLLMTAMMLYVLEAPACEGKRTMNTVYQIAGKTVDELAEIFNALDKKDIAWGNWQKAVGCGASSKTMQQALGLTRTCLQIYEREDINRITSLPGISTMLPGSQKCAYYIITPSSSLCGYQPSIFTAAPIAVSFLVNTINSLNGLTYTRNGRLEVPVHFILEQAPRIGFIPGLAGKLYQMNDTNFHISIIARAEEDMRAVYGRSKLKECLDECATLLYFAPIRAYIEVDYITKRGPINNPSRIAKIFDSISHAKREVLVSTNGEEPQIIEVCPYDLLKEKHFFRTEGPIPPASHHPMDEEGPDALVAATPPGREEQELYIAKRLSSLSEQQLDVIKATVDCLLADDVKN